MKTVHMANALSGWFSPLIAGRPASSASNLSRKGKMNQSLSKNPPD
jgi:hypothetical protein